jgi:hypothetical protein
MISRPVCHACGGTALLRRQIAANSVSQVAWYCERCRQWAEKPVRWIGHDDAGAILAPHLKVIDDLPVVTDYRTQEYACAVCGELGAEYHHWMPQTLARHVEVWPDWQHWGQLTVYLCRKHHKLWHRLVTPWMPGVEP